jgi:hypothetical protein
MKTFRSVSLLDGWGAFDQSGFRLEDSARATFNAIGFTVCRISEIAIAVVIEAIDAEARARLELAPRPPWIDAIGVAKLETAPNAAQSRIVADIIAPSDLDPFAFAFASVCVLQDHGSFTVDVERHEVRFGPQVFHVTVAFDDETSSRFGTVVKVG